MNDEDGEDLLFRHIQFGNRVAWNLHNAAGIPAARFREAAPPLPFEEHIVSAYCTIILTVVNNADASRRLRARLIGRESRVRLGDLKASAGLVE